MLYREIIIVCSQIHTHNLSTLCGRNVETAECYSGGTYSDQTRTAQCWHCISTPKGLTWSPSLVASLRNPLLLRVES